MRLFALSLFSCGALWAECVAIPLMWIPHDAGADALYRFEQDGKAGYIDQSGAVIIPPRSDLAAGAEFHQGLVPLKGQSGRFLDRKGNVVATPPAQKSDAAAPKARFIERGVCNPLGECGLKLGCDFTLAGVDGKPASNETYQNALPFHEGLAAVEKHGKWGFIDETGNLVAAFRFAEARSFSGGLARVRLTDEGSWAFINRSGKMAIAPWFEYADDFGEGLALVGNSDDGFWYIRPDGSEAFPNRFILASRFFKGLAHVKLLDPDGNEEDLFGYIDRTGHSVFTYHRR